MRYVHHTFLLSIGLLITTLTLSGCDGVGSGGDDSDNGDDNGGDDTPTAPAAPSGLSAAAPAEAVELTWESVDEADTYNVYRSTTPTDSAAGSPLQTGVPDAQYTDDTAENGQKYYYRVTALDDTLEGDASDEVSVQVPAATPTSVEAAPRDGAADLTWASVSSADSYNVYRSTTEDDSATGDPLATDVTDASYTDGTAENGRVYYYRVTALADTAESPASDVVVAEMPAANPGDDTDDTWTRVKADVDNTIYDVAYTSEGAYAVAGGGILLKRQNDKWAKVVEGGPSSNGNDLFGLAVTADSTHLWLVGASGAIGEYDVTTGSLTDRSAPMDVTNNFTDVAVTGQSGSARVTVTGASGKVYYSASNGESGTWNSVTPGSGAAVRAVDFYAGTEGHIVDGNQSVHATQDGETWSKTGIADADVGFEGVDSDASDDVWVAGGSGMVFHWNGSEWMPTSIGEPTLIDIVVAADDQSGYAVGNSGAVFAFDGSGWTRQETPTGQNLKAIVQGTPAIAVGASGTVLER